MIRLLHVPWKGLLRSATASYRSPRATELDKIQSCCFFQNTRERCFSPGTKFVSNFHLFGGPVELGSTATDEGLGEQHFWI